VDRREILTHHKRFYLWLAGLVSVLELGLVSVLELVPGLV